MCQEGQKRGAESGKEGWGVVGEGLLQAGRGPALPVVLTGPRAPAWERSIVLGSSLTGPWLLTLLPKPGRTHESAEPTGPDPGWPNAGEG